MYDAIVVGARAAGSPTAMLLAREGHDVLVVDRSTFPSDIMSTHYIHPQGVGLLMRWGLLDRVLETNCPPIRQVTRQTAGSDAVVEMLQTPDGKPRFGLCPRRLVFDHILVDAAREAGADVREGFAVQGLLRDDDGAVSGVTGRDASGNTVTEEARIVIGADGLRSKVAELVEPEEYNEVETLIFGYYAYYSGIENEGNLFCVGPGGFVLMFPTNDEQVCLVAGGPVEEFHQFREDIERNFLGIVERVAPQLHEQVLRGKREERFMGSADLPQYFRKPYGPGWALVGDAGLHVDPTMGLGITKACSEAAFLAPALDNALSGRKSIDEALARFHRQRDEVWIPFAEQNVAAASGVAGREPVAMVSWAEAAAEAAAAVAP
jgi:flavin-dependent dehydrogenase